jgi:hypothetical protein
MSSIYIKKTLQSGDKGFEFSSLKIRPNLNLLKDKHKTLCLYGNPFPKYA